MRNLSHRILDFARQRPEGSPVGAKELLHLGSRAAVDQALSRLAREGKLLRSGRGLYVHPVEGRFGIRAPEAAKVISGVARVRGETIAPSGAASANALGLTTQVPVRLVYLTSGRSRKITVGAQTIELQHVPRWQLINAEQPAGEVVRALAWLGPSRAHEGLARLKHRLPKAVLDEVAHSRSALPGWLADTVSRELVANG